MHTNLTPPFDNDYILRKQRSIKRSLLGKDTQRIPKRIAILTGSTVNDIRSSLELFLLDAGIEPAFYVSEYNQYYEDAVFSTPELDAFNPEIIIIFTTIVNLKFPPALTDTLPDVQRKLDDEYSRFLAMWEALSKRFNALIIQNNFDLPHLQPQGTSEHFASPGTFANSLNAKFADYASSHKAFYLHDINRLCAVLGLSQWHNREQYCAYKLAVSYEVTVNVAWSLCRLIRASLGRVKKCLVLDLDNTLWGGIIGDDGLEGIIIGTETPQAEAFTEFQRYCKSLKERGIILAVCSKNDDDVARSGFTHPDSVLKAEDFASFVANWEPKNVNIRRIASELNIGLDSLVFIDDNPAERAIVRESVPEVSVPEVDGGNVYSYINAIEINGYFDTVGISDDDRKRSDTYRQNAERAKLEHSTANYDDFLASLEMTAELSPFRDIYFDRIAQLTNKTNQFNLTTKRCTLAEIKAMSTNDKYITLSCRLSDKFGDNGIISLMIGERDDAKPEKVNVILWLMSCRVLRRGVENLMMNAFAGKARREGFTSIEGRYYKTAKNGMVSGLYKQLGFELESQDGDNTIWSISLNNYEPARTFIKVTESEN